MVVSRPVVLVVEDEVFIRVDAVEMIEAAGFDVIEARNADDAIKILETQTVHLIFTDIQMPGSMDGLKLAHAVRTRWPPVHIVTTSGHARLTAADLPTGGRFLPKPYTAADLGRVLREITTGIPPSSAG